MFAWRPTVVGKYKVWLEQYLITEKCALKTIGFGLKELVWEEVSREPLFYYAA